MTPGFVDWSPLLQLLLLGLGLGIVPLGWWMVRSAGLDRRRRLRALTLITLFLTFDLVVFGAFTRLSDSGLGCPDWPGCYGSVSPIGAREEIAAEVALRPTGPVTHGKAWVEMVHRYWASAVGFLILVLAALAWRWRQADLPHPGWASLALAWVLLQGAFGAWTVTMKLFPAVVTGHLMLGLGLLSLLAWQAERLAPRPIAVSKAVIRTWQLLAVLVFVQLMLGGWVSTNYAVLVCRDLPTCQGQWWPEMDFSAAFRVWRALGTDGQGGLLSFPALTAIHVTHRLGALAVTLVALALAWQLRAPTTRPWALALVALLVWQVASGVSNVVLGWPLLAALSHSAGAAAWVVVLTVLGARWVGEGAHVAPQSLRREVRA
ncbi:COX15/CtaA family protein [Inhella crocodyli]|uniref:Heme A synthase n=1 Tax=Inhella crocodyli TaxID=2499851 RepID=A0A3S2VB37_9BURK|nr:COX15/CtaA family protein [Inhella crocodyli]RVT82397.1 heme A synthase [Inhella crocodyli]